MLKRNDKLYLLHCAIEFKRRSMIACSAVGALVRPHKNLGSTCILKINLFYFHGLVSGSYQYNFGCRYSLQSFNKFCSTQALM